jgi:hypothetical protein
MRKDRGRAMAILFCRQELRQYLRESYPLPSHLLAGTFHTLIFQTLLLVTRTEASLIVSSLEHYQFLDQAENQYKLTSKSLMKSYGMIFSASFLIPCYGMTFSLILFAISPFNEILQSFPFSQFFNSPSIFPNSSFYIVQSLFS